MPNFTFLTFLTAGLYSNNLFNVTKSIFIFLESNQNKLFFFQKLNIVNIPERYLFHMYLCLKFLMFKIEF